MSRIRVMSEQLSNRIAAGEVIERPASVVKELVENAIDAGAAHIRIDVEHAGSRLIRVTDDGCGMDGDDALLCIEPHGTSKLLSEEAIDHITTLGFRGEAIPSIASVSRFYLLTRTAESLEASSIRVEGGKLLEAAPAGGPRGTRVEVRDLFFNTPARKKFLKSPATEASHIEETVLAIAIPRWEISFELRMDGRMVFQSPGAARPEARLCECFGRQFLQQMRPVAHTVDGITFTGFAAMPGFTRNSRREQRIFINRRPFESPAVYRGIREAYATIVTDGRYAPVVLFMEMAPELVDVNVHPAKREVRFRNEFTVTRAVSDAVARAIRPRQENELPAPVESSFPRAESVPLSDLSGMKQTTPCTYSPGTAVVEDETALPLSGEIPLHWVLAGSEVRYTPETVAQPELKLPPVPVVEATRKLTLTDQAIIPVPENPASAETVPPLRETAAAASPVPRDWPTEFLGIYDDTYIMAAGPEGLVLIDQHAAHERILFERLLDRVERGVPSQGLLIPQTVELPLLAAALLQRHLKTFTQLGFDFEPLGDTTFMLNALPMELATRRPPGEIVSDMLSELLENEVHKLPVEPAFVARAACRAAIKAHEKLSRDGAEQLLRDLAACRQGTLCPHGRPTMIVLTRKELEKRFFRR